MIPSTGPGAASELPLFQRSSTWYRQIPIRFRRYMLLKIPGTALFMYVFFIGYFHVLKNPVFPAIQVPLTVVDEVVSFYPPALWIYVSLWVYVSLAPALLYGFRELVAYGWWVGLLCLSGLTFFYFWPTAVPAPDPEWARYPGFQVLQGVDAAGNACPSLHVATAMFSAMWLDTLLREMGAGRMARGANWLWFAAITWSTLAVKQHVSLDVAGGIVLGVVFAWISQRLRPAAPPVPVAS